MKRFLFILLAALTLAALLTGAAMAYNENTNDDGTYQFDVLEDGTAQLTLFNLNDQDHTEFTLPDTVYDKNGTAYTVTCLGSNSLSLSGVRILTIPDSITLSAGEEHKTLGGDVEEYRVSDSHPTLAVMDGVLFNKAEKALIKYPTKKLARAYAIPDGIQTVAPFAFWGASHLHTLTIPNSTTNVGYGQFQYTNIGDLQLAADHPTLALTDNILYHKQERTAIAAVYEVFQYDIPEGIVKIGPWAFAHMTDSIVAVNTPSTLTEIGAYAFYDCRVQRLSLAEGLERIGDSAFCWCTLLTEIELPESLLEIGDNAFLHDRIKSLWVPANVKRIGDLAFASSDLEEVILPEGLLEIGKSAFYDSDLKAVTVPGSVQVMGSNAFYYCRSLENAVLSEGIEELPYGLFQYCDQLTSVTLPDGLKTIGDCVFSNCTALAELALPEGLESIGGSVFYNCTGLKSLVLPASVKMINSRAFDKTQDLVLTVVKGSTAESICAKYNWEYIYGEGTAKAPAIPDWLLPAPQPVTECPACGHELPEGHDFQYCPWCGKEL